MRRIKFSKVQSISSQQKISTRSFMKRQYSTSKKAHYASIIKHAQTTHKWKKGQGKISSDQLTVILWNVNGFRSVKQKGDLQKLFQAYKNEADFICLNQTKIDFQKYNLQTVQNKLSIKEAQNNYNEYWNFCKVSKGYSGVMTYSKHLPLSIVEDMPGYENHNKEGRMITLEFEKFYLLNLYKPNSGDELIRLQYRLEYQDCFRQYVKSLQEKKPVVIAGDMNVANQQIDLKNPKANEGKACFTKQQRQKFKQLLNQCGLIDTFRQLYPKKAKYSFWSYRRMARANNIGWRLDYILLDKRIKLNYAQILNDVYGSDHCPVIAKFSLD